MGEDQTIDVTAPISELESSTGVKSGIGDENTPDLVTITSQELGYLYTVLLNSSIPAADSAFVAQLQRKLQIALNIKPQ